MEKAEVLVKNDQEDRRPSGKRGGRFAAFGAKLLDQLYPPQCLTCDAPVVSANVLCAACWSKLRPITRPYCPVLGVPFAVDMGPDARSAEAIADPPPFDRARSAVIYDDLARAIVSRLKYGDRPELARFCAQMMALAGHEVLQGDALLVPVPLHRLRQWGRRYNQSTELARELSRLTGLAVEPHLIERHRVTRHQVGLSASQRARNVQGAFRVRPEGAALRAGRRLVIVDDVITTGATVRAMARTLRRAGFAKIDVTSFARVVIGEGIPI